MKIAKKIKRFCPYCKKKTEQKVSNVASGGKRGTLTRGSIKRGKLRGLGVGFGNLGSWGSKPPLSKFKRKTKSTKKTNIKYTCLTCNKSKYQKKGIRVGKIQVEDKK
jgi:large subunit ribosomal protein L44e